MIHEVIIVSVPFRGYVVVIDSPPVEAAEQVTSFRPLSGLCSSNSCPCYPLGQLRSCGDLRRKPPQVNIGCNSKFKS